jgi:hypothetical protein
MPPDAPMPPPTLHAPRPTPHAPRPTPHAPRLDAPTPFAPTLQRMPGLLARLRSMCTGSGTPTLDQALTVVLAHELSHSLARHHVRTSCQKMTPSPSCSCNCCCSCYSSCYCTSCRWCWCCSMSLSALYLGIHGIARAHRYLRARQRVRG